MSDDYCDSDEDRGHRHIKLEQEGLDWIYTVVMISIVVGLSNLYFMYYTWDNECPAKIIKETSYCRNLVLDKAQGNLRAGRYEFCTSDLKQYIKK